ncbi:MAG: hypothetical protein N2C14_16170 [Planctomycetales bacterium]
MSERDWRIDMDQIRTRAGQVYGPGFWGFVNYVVCAYRLQLEHGATWIHATVSEEGLRFASDATIPLGGDSDPFSKLPTGFWPSRGMGADGLILRGLSAQLRISSGGRDLAFRRGEQVKLPPSDASLTKETTLEIQPDDEVLSVTSVAPAFLRCYLKRTSCLYPKVTFELRDSVGSQTFQSPRGIQDLFDSITAPYQLLHEPIHITGEEDELQLELVVAFHSWTEDMRWSFVNKNRVPTGEHETALKVSLNAFRKRVAKSELGYVAVMMLTHPDVHWFGAVKRNVCDPKLQTLVSKVVTKNLKAWEKSHTSTIERLEESGSISMGVFW